MKRNMCGTASPFDDDPSSEFFGLRANDPCVRRCQDAATDLADPGTRHASIVISDSALMRHLTLKMIADQVTARGGFACMRNLTGAESYAYIDTCLETLETCVDYAETFGCEDIFLLLNDFDLSVDYRVGLFWFLVSKTYEHGIKVVVSTQRPFEAMLSGTPTDILVYCADVTRPAMEPVDVDYGPHEGITRQEGAALMCHMATHKDIVRRPTSKAAQPASRRRARSRRQPLTIVEL